MYPTLALLFLILAYDGSVHGGAEGKEGGADAIYGGVGVYRPMSDYEKTLYEVEWRSKPQLCLPNVPQASNPVVITTIKAMQNQDPKGFIPRSTAAFIQLKLTRDGAIYIYTLDAFPLDNDKDAEGTNEETPEFLTPLYSSIRVKTITEDNVEIGVFTVGRKVNGAPLCDLYKYTIPSAPGGDVERDGEPIKCEEWNGNEFKPSSSKYTKNSKSDGAVDGGEDGPIYGGVGVIHPMSDKDKRMYADDWESVPQICRPRVAKEWDPVVITKIRALKDKDPQGTLPRRAVADISLKLSNAGVIKIHKLDVFPFGDDGEAKKVNEETSAVLTPLYSSIRYKTISKTKVEVGVYTTGKGSEHVPDICKLYSYIIPTELGKDVKSSVIDLDCAEWNGNTFKPSSPKYTKNSKSDGTVGEGYYDSRYEGHRVYNPMSEYEKTLYDQGWASKPQTCPPQVAKSDPVVTTTIRALRLKDPSGFIPQRTVADISLNVTREGVIKEYKLDFFPLANNKDTEVVYHETSEFLTPLFSSIRFRKITEEKVEIGVFTVGTREKDSSRICKLYTYTIPSELGQEVVKDKKPLDCADLTGKEFQPSSSMYKKNFS